MNKVFLNKCGGDYYTIDIAIGNVHFDGDTGYYYRSSAVRAAKKMAMQLKAQLVINFGDGKRIINYEHN